MGPTPPARSKHRRVLIRAPSEVQSVGILVAEGLVLAVLFGFPPGQAVPFLPGLILLFLVPMLGAAVLTGPIAAAFGGRLTLKRGLLLSVTAGLLPIPLAIAWRVALTIGPAGLPAVAAVLLFTQGPVLWFRHMTLFGVSSPSHARSLPASLCGPLLAVAGTFVLFPPTVSLLAQGALYLIIGFLASALLLRAADRPIRREFGTSGVSLIRPMLDHINARDPAATEALEKFFARFSVPAELTIRLLSFRGPSGAKATLALPTVHPGPFASLGSSDLPRRLGQRLGADAGTVFVPHTPCSHDLDLPTSAEFDRVASESVRLLAELGAGAAEPRASPLVAPAPDSFARAQVLGDMLLVLVTQAPAPTDDIDFSVVDPIAHALESSTGLRVAFVDAHNSYVEDEGDLTYGSPAAKKLARDAEAAARMAVAAARPGPLRVGTAVREGYDIGATGIGPHGIRALVVEAGGRTTAYVVIDGNNLAIGFRAPILDALAPLVDAAEVLTTDNHIVHEVDGGTNPIGERYPMESIRSDVLGVVRAALADLSEARVASGVRTIPSIPVLRPGWTVRLLTSLGDTLSMFTNAFLTTFLLVLTGSLVILLAFR